MWSGHRRTAQHLPHRPRRPPTRKERKERPREGTTRKLATVPGVTRKRSGDRGHSSVGAMRDDRHAVTSRVRCALLSSTVMASDPKGATKVVSRSVALAQGKTREQRVQRLKARVQDGPLDPVPSLDALMAELGE